MKYEKLLNGSIWTINETLTDITSSSMSGPGSNDNERVTQID